MKQIFNIFYGLQKNIVHTFEVKGEDEDDCNDKAIEELGEFIRELRVEAE